MLTLGAQCFAHIQSSQPLYAQMVTILPSQMRKLAQGHTEEQSQDLDAGRTVSKLHDANHGVV